MSRGNGLDYGTVANALRPHIPAIVQRYLPSGKKVGDAWCVGDIAGNPGESLKVNLQTGKWCDFANPGDKGGDVISLVARHTGRNNAEAAYDLCEEYHRTDLLPARRGRPKIEPKTAPVVGEQTELEAAAKVMLPVPTGAPEPTFRHPELGTPSRTWAYHDAEGRLLFYACRFDKRDGSKDVLPHTFTDKGWRWKSAPVPRPLYGLDVLAARPEAPVLVVEGEKTTDAARGRLLGYAVVSWPGGGKAVHKADWSPLAGRAVTVWPDADEAGRKAAAAVARAALAAGAAEARLVAVPDGMDEGWDLADKIPDGLSLNDLLADAEPCETKADEKPEKGSATKADRGAFGCTDVGNGDRLVERYGKDLRYCFPWKSWMIWDGRRWRRDEAGVIDLRCKATARAIYDECKTAGTLDRQKSLGDWARTSQSRPRLEAMAWAARSEVAEPPEAFDADLLLLNVNNGTLDLRTGGLRPHRREDKITKLAPVDHDERAECPRWLQFLDEVMGGDEEMVRYLQRVAGYCLTGVVEEHCMFILHGDGRNGKSTFIEALHALMSDYAQHTETKTFLHKTYDGANNDLAALRGARMASAVEVARGRRLNEPLIKVVSGGDMITARFLETLNL